MKISAWVLASRPATLTAALVPVMVGTACAQRAGSFHVGPALAALLGAFLIQIGTNFANDVYDHEKGADGPDRKGPVRAVAAGLLSAREVRAGMWAAFALASVAGAYLTWAAGWPVIAIGVVSIASGIAYTGGPYPLGYHGLGDVFVLAFFGFVAVCGTAFVQAGTIPPHAWLAAIPVGSLATAVLVVNNLRDRETDARAGKRTLAVRFGRRFGLAEYALLLAAAYLVPPMLVATGAASAWALLPLLTLPFGVWLCARVFTTEPGPAYNEYLKRTAQLLLGHGALLALGLLP